MPIKRVLTNKQTAFIQDNYLKLSSRALAAKIGCSKFFIQRYLPANGLRVPKDIIEKFRIEGMTGKTTSTTAIDKKLKALYLKVPEKQLAVKIDKSSTFVRVRLRQLGLVIPREIIEQRIADSRIKPGSISFNKGKKQSEWMSRTAINKIRKTQFKTGQLPKNTLHDLAITVRPDNRGINYLWIRISLGKWQPLHRYNWERINGPIAPKMNLVFRDANTMNCNVDNLKLLTNAELGLRNNMHTRYPKEITHIIQLRGALTRQINKHLKRLKNEKQN